MSTTFTSNDLQQMAEKGIDVKQVEQQIADFRRGFPPMHLHAAATVGNGILSLTDTERDFFIHHYENVCSKYKLIKFVPASGAASRMFQNLYTFLERYDGSPEARKQLQAESTNFYSAGAFFAQLPTYAFYGQLDALYLEHYHKSIEEALEDGEYKTIVELLLADHGLGYGKKPKGLLAFHMHGNQAHTAMEEHLIEAALYASSNGVARVHFTVSPEHLEGFMELTSKAVPRLEKQFGLKYEIGFSEQKASTDTLAVGDDNQAFRNPDGSLLFRPGGHGALIENLAEVEAHVAFVKNIDNVAAQHLMKHTVASKKALAGLLLSVQERVFDFLRRLDAQADEALVDEALEFLELELYVRPQADLAPEQKLAFVRKKLNRPIRVCGMVKNEGEPGGGPFWARGIDGHASLQVVESSQIDLNNAAMKAIVQQATHFNPVDLVCSLASYQGHRFDLRQFVDPATGFISQKSKDGKVLKAMELPGLWNGAMSDWNTLFVEVPLSTFNPVKMVNDLAKPGHQDRV